MNIHPLNKIKIVGTLVGIVAVALVIGIKIPDHATATGTDNVHGFLWSDMPDGSDQSAGKNPNNAYGGRGLGWISMNSDGLQEDGTLSNPSAASTIDYGVTIDTTGDIKGMAWGEYAGWLDFDPTGTTPPYNAATQAKIMPACWTDAGQTVCKVIGWARFLAGTQAEAGGWDGWVSLNTVSAPTYGVEYNKTTGEFSGMAWGGDVAGWIDFSKVKMDTNQPTPICTDPAVCPYLNDMCLNITGNQQSVPSGYTQVGNSCFIDRCTNIPGVQQTLPVLYQTYWYDDPNADKVCTTTIPPILGCTNPNADNWYPAATVDDGSCIISPPYSIQPIKPIYKEN